MWKNGLFTMWFIDFVTVFNWSYNCQKSHYLDRNWVLRPFLIFLCYNSLCKSLLWKSVNLHEIQINKDVKFHSIPFDIWIFKGHTHSKLFFQANVSSKKRTNKFVFTTCRLVFIRFLEESDDISKLTDLLVSYD